MIEKMKNIVVFVRDLEGARRFYKELLRLPLVQESPTMMEFFPGGVTLGVALAMHADALALVGRHTGITLQVRDIAAFCLELRDAGVDFAEPLEQTPWGKMAVIKDQDGNQLALVE